MVLPQMDLLWDDPPFVSLQVKIKLPTQLTEKHHVFFTFQHIACEQTKSSSGTGSVKGKPQPIETPGQ